MFNKPYDIVIMVALFAAVFVTIGFGLTAVIDQGGVVHDDAAAFFNDSYTRVLNQSFFTGTTVAASEAIVGTPGSSEEDSGILEVIQKGFKSFLSLGSTYAYAQESLTEAQGILGVPDVYVVLILGCLLVVLFVIVYTWIRGSV